MLPRFSPLPPPAPGDTPAPSGPGSERRARPVLPSAPVTEASLHGVPLRRFATEGAPLRVSALTSFQQCMTWAVMSWVEEQMNAIRDGGSKAADTGTAVGTAVELWHRGVRAERIMEQVENASRGLLQGRPPFPAADLGETARVLRRYSRDPRNPRDIVLPDSLEMTVDLTLDPHPTDPTGLPVVFKGHLDQLRMGSDATLEVWDLKHSHAHTGHALVARYSWQQAVYALATAATLGRAVRWGGIIRTTGYLIKSADKRAPDDFAVFYGSGWGIEDCKAAALQVTHLVSLVRSGALLLTPGDFCGWCPAQSFQACRRETDGAGL
jgi:hypothetical protein